MSTPHDSSTNRDAFSSSEHAVVTGAVMMQLAMAERRMGWRVEAGVTENDDYLPFVILRAGGHTFRLVVEEVTDDGLKDA